MKYRINDIKYLDAEQKFIEEFEKEWNLILFQLKCQQPQLLIGNRLRPKIAFWGYVSGKSYTELDSLSYSNIAQISVSIELLHKASLLFDDWLDNDFARHGEKTFHVEYGEYYTVVFALHLVGLAAWRIKKIVMDSFNDFKMYHTCILKIIDIVYNMSLGALQELQLKPDELYDSTKIKTIAQLETAEIIENSLQIGYIFSQSNDENVLAILKVIGSQCGYLFQTLNDLEAFSNMIKNIKHKGHANFDIDNNRKNIVVTMLWEIVSLKERKKIIHSSGEEIMHIAEKNHLKSFVLRDMETVFDNMILNIHSLSKYNICDEWINSFTDFLYQIRKVAYQRL